MSMARAMERGLNDRWKGAASVPAIHAASWLSSDHAAVREWLQAHEALPGQPEAVPETEIGQLAAQLYERGGTDHKKHLLVFLAHHGSARAASELQKFAERTGPELKRFAELALEEASERAAPAARCLGRHDPCPCGSGRKFKDCCARRLS